jgi:hypothetical protein
MGHPVPKDLKGEERLFVLPGLNLPINKKSVLYNGPASLIAVAIGQVTGNQIAFLTFFVLLNVIAYPFGNSKRSRKKFDNGFMNNDKYVKQLMLWKIRGGGNVYLSHRFDKE